MDETTQATFPPEMETQAVETVSAETEPQVTDPVTVETLPQITEPVVVETDPLPTEEVPATTAATVPPPAPTTATLDIYYGEDSSMEFYAEPTEVVEVTETVGNPVDWELIDSHILGLGEALNLIAGMLLFFTVVTLCYFVYKFFRIFF